MIACGKASRAMADSLRIPDFFKPGPGQGRQIERHGANDTGGRGGDGLDGPAGLEDYFGRQIQLIRSYSAEVALQEKLLFQATRVGDLEGGRRQGFAGQA